METKEDKKLKQQDYTVEQLNNGRRVLDFLRWGKLAVIISLILVILSIVAVATKGFNKGLDFTGGTSIEVVLSKSIDINDIREVVIHSGFKDPVVQNFGSSRDILIRIAPISGVQQDKIGSSIIAQIHNSVDAEATIKRVEFVGPSVGGELEQDGSIAILVCLIAILVYIAFRFEWRLGAGAVFALIHDVLITVGYLAFFHRELDLTIIAALLSIIGYSLNDTIVVFDRIRENFRKIRRGSTHDILNISLTQTLRRTLMTSGTTILVILCLFFFGGSMLHGFAETLGIGVVLGTFSSIYVASYTAMLMGMKREHMLQVKVEKEGADQPSILP